MQSCHSRRPPIAKVTLDGFINGIGKLSEGGRVGCDSPATRIIPRSRKRAGFFIPLNSKHQFHLVLKMNRQSDRHTGHSVQLLTVKGIGSAFRRSSGTGPLPSPSSVAAATLNCLPFVIHNSSFILAKPSPPA
jgi:hypothetical protein